MSREALGKTTLRITTTPLILKKGLLSLFNLGPEKGGMSRIFHIKQGETETQRGNETGPTSHSLSRGGQVSGLLTPIHVLLPTHQDALPGTFS